MNHTIKGIIIVAVMISMLVLGASMVPIMQNSFAYKKSDFKIERDPNTNTNSADSSSDSTATASNTNNINNSACTVRVACPKGSATLTSSTTGTLHITKICHEACGIRFPITVTGNNPQPSSFTLSNQQSQTVKLGPGTFTVHESVPAGFFTPRFTGGGCKQTGPGSPDATGTISAEQFQSCAIINHVLR